MNAEEVWTLFHKAWGDAKGGRCDKQTWKALQLAMERAGIKPFTVCSGED